jgi:hypothetical protein
MDLLGDVRPFHYLCSPNLARLLALDLVHLPITPLSKLLQKLIAFEDVFFLKADKVFLGDLDGFE